jgi:hypothetical protein
MFFQKEFSLVSALMLNGIDLKAQSSKLKAQSSKKLTSACGRNGRPSILPSGQILGDLRNLSHFFVNGMN